MNENKKLPGDFFDKDKFLVDKEIADPFQVTPDRVEIHTYPFDDGKARGYIRYTIREKSLIILDCVITEEKQ